MLLNIEKRVDQDKFLEFLQVKDFYDSTMEEGYILADEVVWFEDRWENFGVEVFKIDSRMEEYPVFAIVEDVDTEEGWQLSLLTIDETNKYYALVVVGMVDREVVEKLIDKYPLGEVKNDY